MRTIKYISIFSLLFLFTLSISSCKKFLNSDVNASSYNDDSTLFSTVGGAYGALLGTYQNLTGDNAYGIRLSLYYTLDNDEMIGPTSAPYPDNTRRDLAHYALSSTNSELEAPVTNLYQGVEQANLCIYFIQRSKLYLAGNTQMRTLLGEAYALRAQFYFDLVKIWGDVPFNTLPHIPGINIPIQPTRTDRDTIYDHLLADLHAVDSLGLIGWTSNSPQRINLATVKGLRARIALYRAGYSLRSSSYPGSDPVLPGGGKMVKGSNAAYYYGIVVKECSDIMAGSGAMLNPSFKSLFVNNDNNIRDKEIMFSVGAGESGSNNGNTNTKLGYYDGPKLSDVSTYGPGTGCSLSTQTVLQYGNGSIVVIPSYFYRFDSSDTRRDVTICIYNPRTTGIDTVVETPTTKMTDGKFRRDYLSNAPYPSAQYMGIPWPLLRYSDILLMYAEAENELNDNTDATTAINQVRARANVKPLPFGLSHDAFFSALERERSLEFGGEGLRKYDLIRWNLLNQKFLLIRGIPGSSTPGPNQIDSFASIHKLWCNGVLTTIPSSVYWTFNNDGSIKWFLGNAGFYEKQITQPIGTNKAGWGSGSAGIIPYASTTCGVGTIVSPTVFPLTGINFITGKSELYPIPFQELQLNPNLQYVGSQALYPNGQNPGY